MVHLVGMTVGYVAPNEGVRLSCGCGWSLFVADDAPLAESSAALGAAVSHQLTGDPIAAEEPVCPFDCDWCRQ